MEGLVRRHAQQIERSFRPVAQKQVLAHGGAEPLVNLGAIGNRHCGIVIQPDIEDAEPVEQVIAAQLLVQPLPACWAAVI